ncbi:MAG: HD domain-containing protein [Spirochaetes bacterium]|nr:HD domain-containing protein [Spirochaetota bacterium]
MYVKALVKQGDIEYNKLDLEEAVTYYSKALALSPDDQELQDKVNLIKKQIIANKAKNKKRSLELKRNKKKLVELQRSQKRLLKLQRNQERLLKLIKLLKQKKQTNLSSRNLDKYIYKKNKEYKKNLSRLIKLQKIERGNFYRKLKRVLKDRNRYKDRIQYTKIPDPGNNTILYIGIVVILVLIVFIIFLLVKKSYLDKPLKAFDSFGHSSNLLIDYMDNIDESKHISDDKYSEIVRAKRMKIIYNDYINGIFSWETIQKYITELNFELKSEILNIVKNTIQTGSENEQKNSLEVILPLITDGDINIREKSKNLIKEIANKQNTENSSDPLNIDFLTQMAQMIDAKTKRPQHSLNVAEIAFEIANNLKNPEIDPLIVKKAALVHDIGYLELPYGISKNPEELSKEQFELLHTHPYRSAKLLAYMNPPDMFIDGIRHHHERINGSGYPNRLKSNEIPYIARIIAVADTFDSLTAPWSYRKTISIYDCLKNLEKMANNHELDSTIVNVVFILYKKMRDIDEQPG